MITFDQFMERGFLPLSILIGSLIGLLIIRSVVFRLLKRWAEKTPRAWDDILVECSRMPTFYLAIAAAIYLGVNFSELQPKYYNPLNHAIQVMVILSITVLVANLCTMIFRNYMIRTSSPLGTSGLAAGLIRGAVCSLGLLMILSNLGISITPLLTALGVGGLAVALALKDTLDNLFSGIYLLTDRTIGVGDFIKLESGQEGRVQDIGWRTTRLRLKSETMVIIPNSKLAQSVLTNYSLPDNKLSVEIKFYVSPGPQLTNLEERLLGIIQKGTEDIVGLLSKPEPTVRIRLPSETGTLEVALNFYIRDFGDKNYVSHEVGKRVYELLDQNKIQFATTTMVLQRPTTAPKS